jgi:putative PEP-CTERM system TPR-repeat lipoprotein
VLRDAPGSMAARLNLAKVAVLMGRKDEAEQMLGDILKQEPANEQALAGLLSLLLEDGRGGRAVALVETARAAAPNNASLTYTLIDLYLRTREPRKAMDLIEAAEKGGLTGPNMNTAKLRTQTALGMTREVRESLEEAVRRNQRDILARRLLVDSLVTSNDAEKARQVMREGLAVMPGDASLVQTLVALELKLGGADTAIRAVDELAKDPVNKAALVGVRGDIYMAAQRFANAASAYSAELKGDPASSSLTVRLANAMLADRKLDAARGVLADWTKAHPDDIEALQALVSLEIGARRLPEAEVLLQQVLAKQPSNVIALNNLAWVYQQRNEPSARAMAQKAYLLSPSPQIADTLGWILTSQGNPAMGLPLLRQAGAQLSSDATVQYHLGVTLKAVGRSDEAISVLRPLVVGRAEFEDRAAAQTLFDELTAKK